MSGTLRNAAVIVAGGEGSRFGAAGGKQLAAVGGLPVLGHTLRAFEECAAVDDIVLVCHPERVEEYRRAAVDAFGFTKVVAVVPGGDTRRASVCAGIRSLPEDIATISVHDGARPLITPETIAAVLDALASRPDIDGVVLGHPSYDTIKIVAEDGVIAETPDRARLWVAQTPQTFRAAALRAAHDAAERDGFEGTDDASLVERAGGRVAMLLGPRDNIKVTVPEDMAYAESVLSARARGGAE